MLSLLILLSFITTYSESTFHTQVYETASSPAWTTSLDGYQACNTSVDSMLYIMQRDPVRLSEWVFSGMGKQKDSKRDAVYVKWKDAEYDAERHYSRIVVDIFVNGCLMFRNVSIESVVTDSLAADRRDIRVDIYYSGSLLKSAYGNFHILPQEDGTTRIEMDTHIRFGWFFNIFISRRVFGDTIDWRLERFVQNLCLFAEGIRPSDDYWRAIDNH